MKDYTEQFDSLVQSIINLRNEADELRRIYIATYHRLKYQDEMIDVLEKEIVRLNQNPGGLDGEGI